MKRHGPRSVAAPRPVDWIDFDTQKEFSAEPISIEETLPAVEALIQSLPMPSALQSTAESAADADKPQVFFQSFLASPSSAPFQHSPALKAPAAKAAAKFPLPVFHPTAPGWLQPIPGFPLQPPVAVHPLPPVTPQPVPPSQPAPPSAVPNTSFPAPLCPASANPFAFLLTSPPPTSESSLASTEGASASVSVEDHAREVARNFFHAQRAAVIEARNATAEPPSSPTKPKPAPIQLEPFILTLPPPPETNPARNPAIPPTDSSPFATIHPDLLRVVFMRYFNIFDLVILRLVCRRWLDAIRGLRYELDLVADECCLSDPSQLGNLRCTFPRLLNLKIAFTPRIQRTGWKRFPLKIASRRRVQVVNDDLVSLFFFSELQTLSLSIDDMVQLTESSMHFSQLRQLHTLSFAYDTSIDHRDNAFVETIANAAALTSLTLRVPHMTDEALRPLTSLCSLTHLDLSWSPKLSTVGALTAFTGLETLSLRGCSAVNSADIRAVAALPRLRRLVVSQVDELLETYTELRATHPQLKLIIET